ncbi:MAG: hypothetical protein WDO56_20850 [Gammaproteobacteria bacterium]
MTTAQYDRAEVESSARRYVAGELTEDEEIAFEDRMVGDVALANEVELTARLRGGLEHLQRNVELARLTAPQSTWRNYLPLATAAGVLLLVGGVAFQYRQSGEPAPVMAVSLDMLKPLTASGRAVSGTYLIAQRRSGGDDLVIDLPRAAGLLRLDVLQPNASPTQQYEIELREVREGTAGESLGQVEATEGADGTILVFVDASRLQAGHYVLNLAPKGSAAPSASYPFTLRSAPQ